MVAVWASTALIVSPSWASPRAMSRENPAGISSTATTSCEAMRRSASVRLVVKTGSNQGEWVKSPRIASPAGPGSSIATATGMRSKSIEIP